MGNCPLLLDRAAKALILILGAWALAITVTL